MAALVLTTCTQPGLGAKVDITAPKVKIAQPAASGTYQRGVLHLSGTVSDDLGVTSLTVTYPTASGDKVANVPFTGTTWSLDLDTQAAGGPVDGKDSITVAASDASGKVTTDTVLVYVDNKAPTVLVTSPSSYGASPPTYSDFVDIAGDAWDASPISRVDLTLHYTLGAQAHTITKRADGTNSWSVRFFLKDTASGPLHSTDSPVLSYSVAVTDTAGNVNTSYYHSQDIYQIINALGAGTLFPTTLELGQLDQGGTSPSVPTGISYASLAADRIDNSGAHPWANLKFSYTSLPTIQFSNLDELHPANNTLAPGSAIVGNLIPPANAGSISPATLVFEVFKAATYDAAGAPELTLTEAIPNAGFPSGSPTWGAQLMLTNLGSSQGFKIQLADTLGHNAAPGPYVVRVSGKANGSGTATSAVRFGIDASAPQLTETSVGNSLSLRNLPFVLSGDAGSGVGLSTLQVDQSADDGATWTSVYTKTYTGNPTSDTWTTPSLPPAPADGSYGYKITLIPSTGPVAILYRSVVYDATAPTLTVTSPAPASAVSSATVNLSGTAGDGSGTGVSKVYYLVDAASVDHSADVPAWAAGTPATAAPAGWSTAAGLTSSWTGSASLAAEGAYRLWVVAVDKVGNTDTLSVHTAGSFVSGTTYTIDALGTTDFTLIGAASNTVGLSFTATGAGTGSGKAWKGTGRLVSFSRDDLPPKLTLTAPPAVINVASGTSFSLSGTTSDTNPTAYPDVTVQYTKNGVPQGGAFSAAVNTAGAFRDDPGNPWSWTFTVDTAGHTTDGDYTFTVTAVDAAGKTTAKTASVTIDTRAPAAVVGQPGSYASSAPQYWLSGTTSAFSGTASDFVTSTFNLISKVYYVVDTLGVDHSGDDPVAAGWPLAAGTSNWSATIDLSSPQFTPEGQFSLWVASYDNAGNRSPVVRRDFGVDQAPPTLTASGAPTYAKTTFAVTGSVDDSNALASLTVTETKNGTANGSVTATTVPVSVAGAKAATYTTQTLPKGGAVDGTYLYTFTATDAAGKTTTLTRTTIVDTVAPTVALTAVPAWVSAPAVTFTGTATDPNAGASGVASVQVQLDGGAWTTAVWIDGSGGANTSGTWNLTASGLAEGGHTLSVRSTDAAGNGSMLASGAFGVDLAPPVLTASGPSATVTAATAASFTGFTGTLSDTNPASTYGTGLTLSLTATQNGTTVVNAAAVTAAASWSWPFVVDAAAHTTDGLWSFAFTATDASGKTTLVTKSVTIDTQPPVVSVTAPSASGWVSTTSLAVTGVANDGTGTGVSAVWIKVDDPYVALSATDHSAETASVGAGWTLATGQTNWSGSAVLSGEGLKTLWVKAYDAVGNLTTAAGAVSGLVNFGLDLHPPVLTFTDSVTALVNSPFTLTGTTTDTNPAGSPTLAVSVDGGASAAVTVTAGLWSYTVSPLPADGQHTYVFTATDIAGKTTSLSRTITVDTTAPAATIATPGNYASSNPLYWLSGATASFGGSASDPGAAASGVAKVYYRVDTKGTSHSGDNPSLLWSLAAGSTNWSTTVNLAGLGEGQFTLWSAAYDGAGNLSSFAQRDFGVDQNPPTLTEVNRAPTSSAKAVFTLAGAIGDSNALATLTITESKNAGAPVSVSFTPSVAVAGAQSATYTTASLPLGVAVVDTAGHSDDGSYAYVLTATDAAGKTFTVNRTVVIDTTPPTLSVSQPGSYLSTNPAYWLLGTTANFSGTAADAVSGVASVYYRLDAVYVASSATDHSGENPASAGWTLASGSTSWSLPANLTALGEGKHTLWAAAYDAAGNLSTLSHQDFGVDQSPPVIGETLLPDASQHTRNAAFTLTGSVTDSNPASSAAASTLTVSVSVNGAASTAATVVGSTWTYTQPAVDGIYSYVITAQDAAGKTASVNRLVLLDTTPPAVTVSTPTPGLWTSSPSLTIAGTAQDGAGSGINKTYYLVDVAANDHTGDIATWNATAGTAPPTSGTAAVWTLAGGLPTSWTGSSTLATEGALRVWAVSSDKAGNTTLVSAVATDGSTWTGTGGISQFGYDISPPSVSETSVGTPSTVVRNADVVFAGAASDSNALGVHALTLAVDGGAAADVTVTAGTWTTTYTVNAVTHAQDGTHVFVFTATDVAGKTTQVTRSVLVDTTPDTATVTAPGAGAWTNLTTPTITGTAGNGTGSGVAQVWVIVDDTAVSHAADTPAIITAATTWKLAGGTSNWSKAWTLSTEGNKKAWVAVLDNAGNWSSFTTLSFGYDTTSPTLALNALGGYKTPFSITGNVSDGASAVATVLVKIDSGTFAAVTVAASWTWPVPAGTFTALSEGTHTVTVLATDGAGNQSTQTGSFNKDTQAPTLSYNNISAGGGTVVQDAAPILAGALNDPSGVASATYSLDVWNAGTGAWNPVAASASLGSPALANNWPWALDLSATGLALPDGKYRVAIGATDGAGNAIGSPLTVAFQLSRTNPGSGIAAPALGTYQNGALTLAGTAADANGVTTVKAKLASGAVDFSSGTTPALPALPVTVTPGVPGLFTTLAPHGLVDGAPVSVWGTPMPVAPAGALSPSTTYYVKYLTPTTFNLAATSGGAALTINTSLATNVLVASASWTFATFHPNWPVTVAGNTLTAANHGLAVGDVVYFAGTTLPSPATLAQAYYVVSSTSTTFQVSATSGGAAVTFSTAGSGVTVSSPTQPVHWLVPSLAVSSFGDGALTAFTQVSAGSGKTSQSSRDFTLDTTAPTIAVTSPVSGTRQVGNLTIVGTTTDTGAIPSGVTGTIQYQVGKNALLANPASWTNANVTGGAYSWSIALGVMSSFANSTSATECDTSGNPASGTNLWKLPVYFQAVDVAGNVSQKIDYYLILDPNGNIPVVTLLQPTQNGLTYGGQQRVTGMASQPVWVHDVEIAVDPAGGSNFPAASVPVTLSGATLSATAHPFSNNMALYFAGSTLPQIGGVPVATTTPYFVVNAAANTLQVSLTPGGSAVTFSNSPAGVTVSVWTAATLTSTGGSVTWYADVNQNNVYPQTGPSQTVSIQARAWNSPTAGGARGTLAGLLTAPLTMTFDSTFPKVQNVIISPNSSPLDPAARSYFSQITTKDHFHVLANIVSSKGVSKIERVESSPLTGTTALYDTAATGYGSTATITAPTVLTSGAFAFGANYQLIITSLGTTDWQAIGAPAGASVGTMFKPTGAGGTGGGQALASDSSGNFTYGLDLAIDSTTLYNNTSGVYSFDLRVTDMTSPQSQVSLQNITLNEDNFYPTSSLLSSATLVGSSFKIQGTATDVGTGSGPIAGLSKVVVYLMRGAAILNIATGTGTSAGTTVSAMDMANGGVIGPVAYPPAESGLRSFSASIDDRSEIGSSDHNGDGFQESLLTNGNGLDWWTQLNTAQLADGPVDVHFVVWDSAGNATHYLQTAFISNSAPSITSVDLGTDLNGDGTIASPAEVTAGVTNYAATNFSVRNNRLSLKVNTISGNYPLSYSIKYAGTELNGTLTSSTLTITNFASIPDSAGTNDRSFVVVVSDSTLGVPQTSTVTVKMTIQNNDLVAPTLSVAPFGQRYTVPLDAANGNVYTDTGKALTAVAAYTDNVALAGTTAQGHVEYAADNLWHAGVPAVSGQVIFRGKAADNQRISSIKATIPGFNGGAGVGAPFTIATWGGSSLTGLTGTGWSFSSDASTEGVSQADGHALNWAFTWDSSGLTTVTAAAVAVSFQATDFNTNVSTAATLTVDVVPYVVRIDTGLSSAYKNNPSAFSRTAQGHYPVADSETIVLNGFNLNGASTAAAIAGSSTGVIVAAPAAVSATTMIRGFPYTITTVGTTNFMLYGSANNTVGTAFIATAAGAGTGTVTTDAKHSARVTVGTTVTSGTLAVSVAGAAAANNANLNSRTWNSQSNGLNNLLLTDDLVLDLWKFTNITSAGTTETTAKYPTMRISPNAAQDVTFAYGHSESDFRLETNSPATTQLWETSPSKYAWTSLAYDQATSSTDSTATGPFVYAVAGDTDRTNNGYDNNTSTKFNFFSRLLGTGAVYPGSYRSGTYKRLLEANWNGTQYDSLRSQNPDMVATSPALIVDPALNNAGAPTKVYLAYYDNLNSQTKFRYGTVGVSGDNIGMGLQEWLGTAHGAVTVPPYSTGFANEGTVGAPISLSPYVRFASVTAGGNSYYSFASTAGHTYLVRLYGQTTGTLAANADVYGYQSSGFAAVNASSVLAGTAMETFTMAATGTTIWVKVTGVAASTYALAIQDTTHQNEGTIATPIDTPRDTGSYGIVTNTGVSYYRFNVIPNAGYQFRLDNVSAGARLDVYTGSDFATGAIVTAGAATPAAPYNNYQGTFGYITGAAQTYLYAKVTGTAGAGVSSTYRVLFKEAGSSFGYQEIAGPNDARKAGPYAAVGVTSTGVAVVAWYDKPNTQLYFSWNNDPANLKGSSESQWQTNAISLDPDFSGWNVSLDVDGADHIHVAYYNSSNGDLRYVYLPSYNGTPTNPVTVDSFLSTGTDIMLKTKLVGANYVPYIVYYEGALTATKNSMRLAYRTNFSVLNDGSNPANDQYTGDWEVGTVPVQNIPKDYKFSLGFKTLGAATNSPIVGYATESTLETGQLK